MPLASGAVRALRPAAFASSSTLRTRVLSNCLISPSKLVYIGCVPSPARSLLDDFFRPQLIDLRATQPELGQDLIGVLPEQRRALHLGGAVGHLDRVADRQVFTARRVVHLDDGAAG